MIGSSNFLLHVPDHFLADEFLKFEHLFMIFKE